MGKPVQLYGITEHPRHMLLPHNIFEPLGSELTGNDLIHKIILVLKTRLFNPDCAIEYTYKHSNAIQVDLSMDLIVTMELFFK
jgi:hypothetical protein